MSARSLIAAAEQRALAEREALMHRAATAIEPERCCAHPGCAATLRIDNASGFCPTHRDRDAYLRADFRGVRVPARSRYFGTASARPSAA